jgi:hypothetical protein
VSENQPSSGANKLIAGTLILMLLLAIYYVVAQSKNQQCRARGANISALGAMTVIDTSWSMAGCKFLTRIHGGTNALWLTEANVRPIEAAPK